ncbi:hypothetical protein BDA96_05G186800 [Sorghum bicolor]|uniref:Rx N-terminal domain-containing protein n=1 Tax=Sorghum bicolor TaxID=4558 RepID=A0A921UFV6_SORBI|nr:hypothetical protein BDA96_05G186800 [Sorghum bicolor]
MAAEMVGSAVAQEAVNKVLSRIKEGYVEKSDAKEHIERMEMAHIKLEAALETSNMWNITSAPLLRWRSKLKRATQECDHALRRCRQRFQEEEEVQQAVQSSSFPKRVAHTAMSFVSSIFSSGNDDELRGSTTVRRFERFADGATEFLRYVELGGTPCRYMFSVPLIRHLLAGKRTKYCFVRGGQHLSLILQPFSLPNNGMGGSLVLLHEDGNVPQNNFLLSLSLRLSESTDIVGVVVGCLQLFIRYLSSTAGTVKTKLTQMPTQDLCWVFDDEQHNRLHSKCSKWFQPNPFCCQQQDHPHAQSSSSKSLPCDIYLEPVFHVYLLGHVTLSVGNNRLRAVMDGESQTSSMRDFPYLKLGAHFWPHASFEDLSPTVWGSVSEIINNEEKQCSMYANISFEQLAEITMPKAVDCLSGNVEATSYQMLSKSKHGSAYLQVERTSWRANTRKKDKVGKRRKQRQDKEVPFQGWISANNEFISSWITHMPAQLQGSVVDYWMQKEKRSTRPFLLKSNACTHDCPIKMLSLKDHSYLAGKFNIPAY